MLPFIYFKEIESICEKYNIENYTINSDGTIDVDKYVLLSNKSLSFFPLKFNKVTGDFYCDNNNLVSLEGAPKKVGGDFNCSGNQLTTLKHSPKEINGYFSCNNNQLTTLEGCTEIISDSFFCVNNYITNLKGGPKIVERNYNCDYNDITSLEGAPENIGGEFSCRNNKLFNIKYGPNKFRIINLHNNPVNGLVKIFKTYKEFKELLEDYNYLRGNEIIRVRFEQACIEANVDFLGALKYLKELGYIIK